MNETQEGGRSRRVKAVASISASLSLLVGGLLFAEHDASANHVPEEFSALFHSDSDPLVVDQAIVLGTPTTQTGTVGQVVNIDGINVDQLISLPLQNNTTVSCPNLLLAQAVTNSFDISQLIQLGGCPVPSG